MNGSSGWILQAIEAEAIARAVDQVIDSAKITCFSGGDEGEELLLEVRIGEEQEDYLVLIEPDLWRAVQEWEAGTDRGSAELYRTNLVTALRHFADRVAKLPIPPEE